MERQRLEVGIVADRLKVMAILADNGYTVRKTLVKPSSGKGNKITVVEYWKEEK